MRSRRWTCHSTSGTIQSVTATDPRGRAIPVSVSQGRLWPDVRLAPGEPVTVDVVLRRSGWISWLAGTTDTARLTLRTPSAAPSERYLTLPPGSPVKLEFDEPVRTLVYREGEHLQRRELAQPVAHHHDRESGVRRLDRSRRRLEAVGETALSVAGDLVPRRRPRERRGQPAAGHEDLAEHPDLRDVLPAGLRGARPR